MRSYIMAYKQHNDHLSKYLTSHRRSRLNGLNITCIVIIEYYDIFLRATAVPAGTAEARISYGDSVCLSVRPSQPGAEPSQGEIETSGLHHMIA